MKKLDSKRVLTLITSFVRIFMHFPFKTHFTAEIRISRRARITQIFITNAPQHKKLIPKS